MGELGLMFTSRLMIHAFSGLIEIYFVAKLGLVHLSAVALCGIVLNIPLSFFSQIGTAVTALVAQHIGAGNRQAAAQIVGQAILLSAIICFGVSFGGVLAAPQLLRAVGADAAMLGAGVPYLRLGFGAMFALLLPCVLSDALSGAGHAAVATGVELLQTAILAVLIPTMILGIGPVPRLGTLGAMLAIVVARLLAALVQLTFLASGHSTIPLALANLRLDFTMMRRLLGLSLPAGGQSLARYGADATIAWLVAGYGTTALAGFTISYRLSTLLDNIAQGMSMAVFTIVGQSIGARQTGRALHATWMGVCYSLSVVGTGALFAAGLAPTLVAQFNADPNVIVLGTSALRIMAGSHVLSAVALVIMRSFQGAGDMVTPMVVDLVVLWAIQVPLAFALAWGVNWQTNGIWLAIAIASLVRVVIILPWFYRRTRTQFAR